MRASKVIYLGIKGSALAVDAATGKSLWATRLKGSEFVNVVPDGDSIYAATRGELFCLDAKTGSVKWHNPLKGYGWDLVSIALEGASSNTPLALAAEKRRRDQEAAASSGSTASSAS